MSTKPEKPTPDFPLQPQSNGQWGKRIRGKMHYFGKWDDPDAALERYHELVETQRYGTLRRDDGGDAVNVEFLCNLFLNYARGKRDRGEIGSRTYDEYQSACVRIIAHWGYDRSLASITPSDVVSLRESLPDTWSIKTRHSWITRMRAVLNYAGPRRGGVIPVELPLSEFKPPASRQMRVARAEGVQRLFEPQEILAMLSESVGLTIHAFIWLGINCGFGNEDVAELRWRHVDLDGGWIDYPRPKTGVSRRCKLWTWTANAIETYGIDGKKNDHVFLTRHGNPWNSHKSGSPVSGAFTKIKKSCGLHERGRGFYALRSTFQTVGDMSRDPVAVSHVMGHVDSSMAGIYRKQVQDERLEHVANVVQWWLMRPLVG